VGARKNSRALEQPETLDDGNLGRAARPASANSGTRVPATMPCGYAANAKDSVAADAAAGGENK
jgi:hypothetical protein